MFPSLPLAFLAPLSIALSAFTRAIPLQAAPLHFFFSLTVIALHLTSRPNVFPNFTFGRTTVLSLIAVPPSRGRTVVALVGGGSCGDGVAGRLDNIRVIF